MYIDVVLSSCLTYPKPVLNPGGGAVQRELERLRKGGWVTVHKVATCPPGRHAMTAALL